MSVNNTKGQQKYAKTQLAAQAYKKTKTSTKSTEKNTKKPSERLIYLFLELLQHLLFNFFTFLSSQLNLGMDLLFHGFSLFFTALFHRLDVFFLQHRILY